MKKPDGGPAFPQVGNSAIERNPETGLYQDMVNPGMTLRDWFAGKALQAYATRHDITSEHRAKWAYDDADAMLAEREK